MKEPKKVNEIVEELFAVVELEGKYFICFAGKRMPEEYETEKEAKDAIKKRDYKVIVNLIGICFEMFTNFQKLESHEQKTN